MPIPFDVADNIFKCAKTLQAPLRWELVKSNNKARELRKRLECRVAVDGTIPRGVWFRIIVYPRSLSCMSFQLECDHPQKPRQHIPLYRLEMSPVRAHTNKLYGDDEINGLFLAAGQTHEHAFYDSLTAQGELRVDSCQQARGISSPPEDFATGLEFVCGRIHVSNGADVPPPEDQGMLF